MLEMCLIIYTSKQKFEKDEFGELCKQIGYDPQGSSISKFVAIGARYKDFKRYRDSIPSNWTTMYQLTHVKPDALNKAVKNGTLTAQTTAQAISARLLGRAPRKTQALSNPLHSIALNWKTEPDCGQVGELLGELEPMRARYGNFDIAFSHKMESLIKRSEHPEQEFMDEVHREIKKRFRAALTNAKTAVPKRKTFVDHWGYSEQELTSMPINEALSNLGYERDQRVGNDSYNELVSRHK